MNAHPVIFPKLIALFNKNRDLYYDYLNKYYCDEWEAADILKQIREWDKRNNKPPTLIDK